MQIEREKETDRETHTDTQREIVDMGSIHPQEAREGGWWFSSLPLPYLIDPIHTVIPPQLHDSSRGSSQPQRWRFFPTCDISEGHVYGEVLWGNWNREICPCFREEEWMGVTPTQGVTVRTRMEA